MLRSGRKINNKTKDKRSLPQYFARMAEQRVFGKEIAVGLGLFCNALG